MKLVAILCLFFPVFACVGCQGLTHRGREVLGMTGDGDDDWSYPNRAKSQAPRPVATVAKRNAGSAMDAKASESPATAYPLASSAKLRDSTKPSSQGPVAYGRKETKESSKASTSKSDKSIINTNAIASTDTQDIDIEGALGSLPAEYRDILKKQLEGVQTKLASTDQTGKATETLASNTVPSDRKTGVSIRLSDSTSSANPPATSSALATPSLAVAAQTNPLPTATSATSPTPTTAVAANPTTTTGVVTASGTAMPTLPTESSVVTASASVPMLSTAPSLSAGMQSIAPASVTWKQEINQAIELLEKQVKETPASDEALRLSQEVTLRLLYVSQRRLADACRPIDLESLSDSEQEFLRNQMIALHEASNPEAMPVRSRHWSLVMNSQREATNHLAAASNLEVKSLSFCTEVERYGVITKFPKNHFQADQEVLLYCEIENVAAEKIRNGFETQLQGSYEIIDSQGRKVADQLLPMEPDVCQNHRRDYFIVYKIYMPQQIANGNYQLRLTIEDLKARKFGQGQVDFQIKR
jgi:hypothetical protein